jgi:hypothetical protein
MPKFVTIHQAPGLSREEFAQTAPAVLESKHAHFLQVFANVFEGFIVSVYEAADRAALEREFERLGFPFEQIHEAQLALTREDLAQMVANHGG